MKNNILVRSENNNRQFAISFIATKRFKKEKNKENIEKYWKIWQTDETSEMNGENHEKTPTICKLNLQQNTVQSALFCSYLNSSFAQWNAESHLFAQENVRIVRFLEQSFQLLQLLRRERGAITTLTAPSKHIFGE